YTHNSPTQIYTLSLHDALPIYLLNYILTLPKLYHKEKDKSCINLAFCQSFIKFFILFSYTFKYFKSCFFSTSSVTGNKSLNENVPITDSIYKISLVKSSNFVLRSLIICSFIRL